MSRIPLDSGWSNEPAPSEQNYRVPLLRCRKGKPLEVVFLAPMAIGRYLHWDGFRTVPCLESDCPWCAKNVRRDWKLYCPVWQPACDQVSMLELPYSALKFFQKQYVRAQTCYSFRATIARHADAEKGKVVVIFQGKYAGVTPLPEGPCPRKYMERVWGILPANPTPTTQTGCKSHPRNGVSPVKTGSSRQPGLCT